MRLLIVLVIFGACNAFVLSTWPKVQNWMTKFSKQNKINKDPLTELRVEYVKEQILKKLRLSKPPVVSMPLSTLPKPLINGNVLELRPGEPLVPDKPAESFYGKTDQIVVFPHEGKIRQIEIDNVQGNRFVITLNVVKYSNKS